MSERKETHEGIDTVMYTRGGDDYGRSDRITL